MNIVVIVDQSAGNETVGEMWQETFIFDSSKTLQYVMDFLDGAYAISDTGPTKKRITLTIPREDAL